MADTTPTPEDPVKTEAGEIAKDVVNVLGGIGPLIPIPYVPLVLSLVHKYGEGIIDRLEVLWTNQKPTLDDIRNVFSGLRSYESFGIPDVAPTPPVE